jgi:hypothetical protein
MASQMQLACSHLSDYQVVPQASYILSMWFLGPFLADDEAE